MAWQRVPKPSAALPRAAGRLLEDCHKLPAGCQQLAGCLPAACRQIFINVFNDKLYRALPSSR